MKHNWGDTTMYGHKMSLWVVMRLKRPVTPTFDRLIRRLLLKGVSINKRNKDDTLKWGDEIRQIVQMAAWDGAGTPVKLNQLKTCLAA
jgi:hypothetical protein